MLDNYKLYRWGTPNHIKLESKFCLNRQINIDDNEMKETTHMTFRQGCSPSQKIIYVYADDALRKWIYGRILSLQLQ